MIELMCKKGRFMTVVKYVLPRQQKVALFCCHPTPAVSLCETGATRHSANAERKGGTTATRKGLPMFVNTVLATALSVFLVMLFSCVIVSAATVDETLIIDGKTVRYSARSITMKLDGQTVECKSMFPVALDDYTYVSARDVFEFFGATVDWRQDTQQVFIGLDGQLVVLTLGSTTINANGALIDIPVTPRVVNERTMIPVRFASLAFGFSVDWDAVNYTVIINSNKSPINPEIPTTPTTPNPGYTDEPGISDPVKPGNINPDQLAKDVSSSVITTENNAQTEITGITQNGFDFIITASSPISSVTKTLLLDNRLIIDINNAKLSASAKSLTVNNTYMSGARIGQFETSPQMITRVVFDLTAPVSYSIVLSADRQNILVSFEKSNIQNVSCTTNGFADTIFIDADVLPLLNVFVLTKPDRLVIDLPLATMNTPSEVYQPGMYVKSIRTSQFDVSTGRIVIDLNSQITYNVTRTGNRAAITLNAATHQNISYDDSKKTIILPKAAGVFFDINAVTHRDDYLKDAYYLDFPVDLTAAIGYGEFYIKDDTLSSAEIINNAGRTTIKINTLKTMIFEITEDATHYYIRAMRAKDKYPYVVVIDPGHGGSAPGTSAGNLREKDLNLQYGLKAAELISHNPNIKVYLTRNDDSYVDNKDRALFANAVADVFISIHNNWFDNPNTVGTEVLYLPHSNDTELGFTSLRMAEIAVKNLTDSLGSFDRGAKKSQLVVFSYTKIPAILCEIGFMSNAAETAKLVTPDYQLRAAQAIYKTVLDTFDEYRPSR